MEMTLKKLCDNIRVAYSSIGNVNYDKKGSEKTNLKFRRSLYFVRDISKGELITKRCCTKHKARLWSLAKIYRRGYR